MYFMHIYECQCHLKNKHYFISSGTAHSLSLSLFLSLSLSLSLSHDLHSPSWYLLLPVVSISNQSGKNCRFTAFYCFTPATGTTGTGSYRPFFKG